MTGDTSLNVGTGQVTYFDEEVSPFAGFRLDYPGGFDDLYHLFPEERSILYATPSLITQPEGWQLIREIKGLQFAYSGGPISMDPLLKPVPLHSEHVEAMMQLAALTRPGPFGPRTIEFGHYYGIFEGARLVAMAGQRLHLLNHTEISAVCTHPDYLGRGFAAILIRHQIDLICHRGQVPFLHVREDNDRAIALYERLGFAMKRPMNFYILKR